LNNFSILQVTTPVLPKAGETLLNMLKNTKGDQKLAQLGLASLSLAGTGKGQLNLTANEKSNVRNHICNGVCTVV